MHSGNQTVAKPEACCWETPPRPSGELINGLKGGPFAAARGAGPEQFERIVATLRRRLQTRPAILVGAGTCGLGAGARATLEAIRAYLRDTRADADVLEVGCVGLCSEEPIVDVKLPGRTRLSFGNVSSEDVPAFLDAVLNEKMPELNVLGQFREEAEAWEGVPFLDEHPFMAGQRRVVLVNSGIVDPTSIDEYIARGGYSSMAKVMCQMTREETCQLVEESGLRGRGGGGFPTGRKWRFALGTPSDQKYLVCNADEGDPGAFMDRAVCESDPHRVIEGLAIAAYAVGATKAYIYIRAEYPLGVERLKGAIGQAKAYGLLGDDILDSGNGLDIIIKMGAGAFVCGEETALLHSIEGKRGMPRPRPPYPATKGLFGSPTVINNVETLANLPMIFERGPEWFAGMGTEGSHGTKVFALSGTVARTGLVEVPMGTPLRDVVFELGGGIPHHKACKAVQIGGPSGGCIPEAYLDLPTDYEALKEFGAIMGSGGLVVLDESTCMVDLAKFFMEFIQSESCGKCIPCREGTSRLLEILAAITRPRHREDGEDALLRFQGVMHLKALAETIKQTSLCGLGQTAPNPVLSTLKWFRDEYEAHVYQRSCPAGACTQLVGAPCQNGCPVGTEVWHYVAHIARGEYESAYRAIRQSNPFPSACARVCHHPCERSCRAGVTGSDSVAIRGLKRFVVDTVDPGAYKPEISPASENSHKIAIIGAGPAGLSAAHYLSIRGHKVVILEKEYRPGGMMVSAIPAYRLPRDLLQKEIELLLNENIEVKYGAVLGEDFSCDDLFAQGFSAVFVAVGAHTSRRLGLENENVEGIHAGIKFLKAHNLAGQKLVSGRVGVVGGGNSAMDAARVAIRMPEVDEVTVYYRRTRNEMPAYPEEVAEGLKEGVKIVELVNPTKVTAENGKLKAMTFIRNELGEPDASGRRRPVPVEGSEFTVELDSVIAAVSETPDPRALDGVKATKWGTVSINSETFETSRRGVFSGGDAVTGSSTIIEAVAAGKNAAVMIDRYVQGKLMKVFRHQQVPRVFIEPPRDDGDGEGSTERRDLPLLPADQRVKNFSEVELCFSEEDARREARRCLRCDLEFTQPS
ncbi:MAG: FAD-dependent oxidoreductase [Planctomycetota bacterium]